MMHFFVNRFAHIGDLTERVKQMLDEDVRVLREIIDELKANRKMDQIDFLVYMTEAFDCIDSVIEYEFSLTWQRHTVRCRDRPEAEVNITWTCSIEVALELEWFMEHFLQEHKEI